MNTNLFNKIADWLLFVQPDIDSIPFLDRIKTIAFYLIVSIASAGAIYNIGVVLDQGLVLPLVMLSLSEVLLLASLVVFWITRQLKKARNLVALALIMSIAEIIIHAGGIPGFGNLYFIAGYSVLYLLFGLRMGNTLALAYFVGITLRLRFGSFHKDSMYQNPMYIDRVLAIVGMATALGIMVNFCMEMFVRHISRLALQDPITHLPNRYKIEEYLRAIIRKPRRGSSEFSVIGIKILNFNRINAILGTNQGDILLGAVGERMCASFSPESIVGRWSGSLFIVVLDTSEFLAIEMRCAQILSALSAPFEVDGRHVSLLMTAVVCRYPMDATTGEQIMGNVISLIDRHQYHPGEIVFFSEQAMHREIQRYALMEAMGKASLDQEFSLVYQPKVRFSDEICIGAEILLRWTDPDKNEIAPDEFIPVAEESGFIKYLTRWVIHRVFSDLSTRSPYTSFGDNTDGYAINLSVMDLKDRDFIPFLVSECKLYKCPSECIEFEVTEGMLVDEDPQIKKTLDSLISMGFRIAIDDFGTGYSSLSYLNTLRARNLKIDQSFVRMITRETVDKSHPIIDAIIAMGASLGFEITAEGVETEEQAAYLRVRGCHTAQGWLYSKGLPFAEYERYRAIHT